jgi:hypothetical protein
MVFSPNVRLDPALRLGDPEVLARMASLTMAAKLTASVSCRVAMERLPFSQPTQHSTALRLR